MSNSTSWMAERQLHFMDCEDSESMQLRMHRDLEVISALSGSLAVYGMRVIVENGYAIDAACSGQLTRMHYDGDILVATPGESNDPQLRTLLEQIANEESNLDWYLVQEDQPSWVSLYESNKRRFMDEENDTELAQRINVHIAQALEPFKDSNQVTFSAKPGVTYVKPVIEAAIKDTMGHEFNLQVATAADSAATKTRWIRSFGNLYGGIQLRESDEFDFEMLFNCPRFDAAEYVNILRDYYVNKGADPANVPGIIARELQPVKHLLPNHLAYLAISNS